MRLTYGDQTINFFPIEIPKKIVISLSGGLDSASIFYLTCKHFPEIEIVPFCCRDINAPKDAIAAENIVKWMRNEFPNVNIHNLIVKDFDDRSENFISWKECDDMIKTVPRFNQLNRIQVSKILQIHSIAKSIMKENKGAVRVDGMTNNPPTKEMKMGGFYDLAERRRDQENKKQPEYRTNKNISGHDILDNIYQPYLNVNKKFVAGVYQENNLMNSLYLLTRSCTGTAQTTNNFTKECHSCFWCYEKKWAFDLKWD